MSPSDVKQFPAGTEGLPVAGRPELVPLTDGDSCDLRIVPVKKRIGDAEVRMLAYNGSIPGPTLKVKQGSEITVNFTNNMESIRNVYQGANTLGCFNDGLSSFVVTVDPTLDARVRDEIQDAVDAIAAIEPPFRASITNPAEAADIQAAIDTINVLRQTIEGALFTAVVTEGEFAF